MHTDNTITSVCAFQGILLNALKWFWVISLSAYGEAEVELHFFNVEKNPLKINKQ